MQGKRNLLRVQRNNLAVNFNGDQTRRDPSFFGFHMRFWERSLVRNRVQHRRGFVRDDGFSTKGDFTMITGAQCRAARALVEWSRDKLASNSGVDALVIEEFERKIDIPGEAIRAKLQAALEHAGAAFIAENGGGVGVRLKFNRSEVRRIAVLENEGGIVGTDDVP
jgi:hypothetical protein